MTRRELLDLTTDLLGGEVMGTAKFTRLLNIAKNRREGQRPWVYLQTEDSGSTGKPSDNFLTAKQLYVDVLEILISVAHNPRSFQTALEPAQECLAAHGNQQLFQ